MQQRSVSDGGRCEEVHRIQAARLNHLALFRLRESIHAGATVLAGKNEKFRVSFELQTLSFEL